MGSSETRHGGGARLAQISRITNLTSFLFVVVVSLAVFEPHPSAVSPQAPQAPQASNWPQFRGDPKLSGVAAADLPAALSLKWTYEGGETIESSAAIVDGVVYAG